MTIILQIVIKDEGDIKEAISYLDNAMRHIADDWQIDQCLHTNPYIVDEDTFT